MSEQEFQNVTICFTLLNGVKRHKTSVREYVWGKKYFGDKFKIIALVNLPLIIYIIHVHIHCCTRINI